MTSPKTPDPFLQVRVHDLNQHPTLCGLCVGYEAGAWRATRLAHHAMEWLPEFALTAAEWKLMNHADSVKLIRKAAQRVYTSEKFKGRGEFGELFLHAAIRQVHNSIPAVSKLFYKTAFNDTVKGFDAVHVVGAPDDLELWVGESKFYDDMARAVRDVVEELDAHTDVDWLRGEFILISDKIDESWDHASELRRLLDGNTSLDEVFRRVCIPVFLTYDSACISSHSAVTDDYVTAFSAEVSRCYDAFATKLATCALPPDMRVHLFLMPLASKERLVAELDAKLKIWQQI